MKTITNFLLVLTLTASMAFADGHTGTGNRCDTCPPPCTENCPGSLEEEGETITLSEAGENDDTSFTEYVTEIFFDLFG